MNAKGGYQIVNLKNTNLTAGTAATIPGVYDAIEGNYRKPVLLAGIQVGSTEYPDAFITPTVSSTKFVFDLYGYSWEITSADAVKATAITA